MASMATNDPSTVEPERSAEAPVDARPTEATSELPRARRTLRPRVRRFGVEAVSVAGRLLLSLSRALSRVLSTWARFLATTVSARLRPSVPRSCGTTGASRRGRGVGLATGSGGGVASAISGACAAGASGFGAGAGAGSSRMRRAKRSGISSTVAVCGAGFGTT